MTAPTEQQHATALLALLADIGVTVYEVDKVAAMQNPPARYVEFELEWRFGSLLRSTAQRSGDGYRFTTYGIAKTVGDVRECLRRVAAAVDGARVVIGDYTSTPIQRESSDSPRQEGSHFVGFTTWTYSV